VFPLRFGGKYLRDVLFGVFMSLGMSLVMSITLTLINLGLVPDFPARWLRAFLIGFAVGFPTSLVIVPLVRKIVNRLVD
jgi:hypothetical protein